MSTPSVPPLREQIHAAPGGAFLATCLPAHAGGYLLTVTRHDPEPEELLTISLPEWDSFRPASAGHRLIEHGYQVLPAAHYQPDRAAGWKNGIDGLSYTAPVYHLPPAGSAPDGRQPSNPGNPTTTAIELLHSIETLATMWEAEGHHEDAATIRSKGPEFAARLAVLIAENPAEMLPIARQELDTMLTALRSKAKIQ